MRICVSTRYISFLFPINADFLFKKGIVPLSKVRISNVRGVKIKRLWPRVLITAVYNHLSILRSSKRELKADNDVIFSKYTNLIAPTGKTNIHTGALSNIKLKD